MTKVLSKKLPKGKKVLGLRTVGKDHKANNNFIWPEKGYVAASDWSSEEKCGNGLHALIKGEGNAGLLNVQKDALWQVVQIVESEIIVLKGKGKFPRCIVTYTGNRDVAIKYIQNAHPEASVVFGQATAGNYGKATAGDYGQATAGNYGKATAGDYGQATAGNNGQATAGYYGKVAAGNNGQATAGDFGQATAGNNGQATAGYYGKATAGDYGQATAGDFGQATAGNNGQATAGNYGQATTGEIGILQISFYDGKRTRIAIGYIGENGLKPNTTYKLDINHVFIEVE